MKTCAGQSNTKRNLKETKDQCVNKERNGAEQEKAQQTKRSS